MPYRSEYLDFLRDSSENNPYVLVFQAQLHSGARYSEAVKGLFRQRGILRGLPETPQNAAAVEDVTTAILVANLGLIANATAKAVRAMESFYERHKIPDPHLDYGEASSIAIEKVLDLMGSYDPEGGMGFYNYSEKAIIGALFRELTLPEQFKMSTNLRSFIFFNEASVIGELLDNKEPATVDAIEAALVEKFETASYLRNAYRTLLNPMESLDARNERRRMQELAMGKQGNTEGLLGDRPSAVMIDIEPEGDGDPQEREKLLFEEFDPGNDAWQKRLWEMLYDIGFLSKLTHIQRNIFIKQFTPSETQQNWGKFLNNVEIGALVGVSRERIRQILVEIQVFIDQFLEEEQDRNSLD